MKKNISIGIVAIATLLVISYVGITHGASVYVPLEALWNRVVDNSADDASIAVEVTSGSLTGNAAIAGTATVTGATVLNGGLVVDGGVVTVNEASGDYDFRVESNDVTDALKIDAGLNVIQHGTWDAYDYIETTAASYSLASTGRAGNIIQTVGSAATFHLMTELLTTPGAGAVITIKTGGANDVVIDTEGAEDIDGADTYTLDGAYEAVTLTNNGTNWFILSGYLE
jgi:hypothetical protein